MIDELDQPEDAREPQHLSPADIQRCCSAALCGRHSAALGGTRRHSAALGGTRRHSAALGGTWRHSSALGGTQLRHLGHQVEAAA